MAIGPVIGGQLAGTLGFRWIFWLLVLLGSLAVILLFLLLPETLRAIAGDGSTPLKGWKYEPILSCCTPWKKAGLVQQGAEDLPQKEKLSARMFFEPMLFLLEKDVACTLFYGAVIYTVFSMVSPSAHIITVSSIYVGCILLTILHLQVSASTSSLLAQNYHLSTVE